MKGYPSRKRVRKAFERGARDAIAHRSRRNPYRNRRLHALYERGYQMGGSDGRRPRLPPPTRAPAPRPAPAPRKTERPRPFAPQPRRGGWR